MRLHGRARRNATIVPLALGAAPANEALSGDHDEMPEAPFPQSLSVFALGAAFFAAPVAPTGEVAVLAAGASWLRLRAILLSTLLVTHLALYELEFQGQSARLKDLSRRIETVETGADGESLRVRVRLDNRRGAGLQSVTVGGACGAAERTLEFTHVPAGGYRRASVICPAGTTPETAVETWIEARFRQARHRAERRSSED